MECALILHNIRSTHNVGSIFRTADAAGVSKIYLTGYTPGPLDRFGRARSDVAKVALGAEKTVPSEQSKNLASIIKKLSAQGGSALGGKKEKYLILALEQHPKSISLFDFKLPKHQKFALLLGNEVRGLSPSTLRLADHILEIPMRGSMVRQAHHP